MPKNIKQQAFDEFFRDLDFNAGKVSAGRILISEPFLNDPNFSRTVVLLVKHGDEGSLGFVLNHESDFTISELIEDFPEIQCNVFHGGPVGNENVFFIHSRKDLIGEGIQIMDGLHWGGNFDEVKKAVENEQLSTTDIMFFIGYSGWEAGQLEDELKSKSWIVADITVQEVLKASGELWQQKLSELGKDYHLLSKFPADPSMN